MTFAVNYYFNIFVIHDFDSISISYSHTHKSKIQTPKSHHLVFLYFFSLSFRTFFQLLSSDHEDYTRFNFQTIFYSTLLYICQSFGINMAFVFVRSQKNANTQHIVRFNKAKKAVCEMESKSNCRISVKRQRIYCYGILSFIRSISLFSNDSLLLT